MNTSLVSVGDVFEVPIRGENKAYFWVIGGDPFRNSIIIRVFKTHYPVEVKPELSTIVADEIDFHAEAHVIAGINNRDWVQIGNVPFLGKMKVLFRVPVNYNPTLDALKKEWLGWSIWEPGKTLPDYKWKYCPDKGTLRKTDIGGIFPPDYIIRRIENGYYKEIPAWPFRPKTGFPPLDWILRIGDHFAKVIDK